jgi:hypothetical protein
VKPASDPNRALDERDRPVGAFTLQRVGNGGSRRPGADDRKIEGHARQNSDGPAM